MKPLRICLPSQEREEYIAQVRSSGLDEINVRVKNRYIDEFLRFCSEHFDHATAKKVTTAQIKAFARHVAKSTTHALSYSPSLKQQTPIKLATARLKVQTVIKWCEWLDATGRLKSNPAKGLNARSLIPDSKTPR